MQRTLYVIRHAIAEDRAGWRGPDEQRPLTADGLRQARALAVALGDSRIDRVFSSPSVRCRQTVEPLADRLGLPLEDSRTLAEGAGGDGALRFLLDLAEPLVAGCTHGDIVEEMLELLLRQGVVSGDNVRFKKASTWVLTAYDGAVRGAHYVPPP